MLNLHKATMNWLIVLLLLVSLLFPIASAAQELSVSEQATANRLLVTLEQCEKTEKQLVAYENGNVELQNQITIIKSTIQNLQELVSLQKDKEEVYKNLLEMERKMAETKEKVYQEQLKAAKPTFIQEVGKYSTGGVLGAVILGLILLL